MQNIAEKSVSLVFRASQGRGLQKFFRGQAPGPPCLLATLAPCPPKSRDLATPLIKSTINCTLIEESQSHQLKNYTVFEDLQDSSKQKPVAFIFYDLVIR